jgi:hypothetical protein
MVRKFGTPFVPTDRASGRCVVIAITPPGSRLDPAAVLKVSQKLYWVMETQWWLPSLINMKLADGPRDVRPASPPLLKIVSLPALSMVIPRPVVTSNRIIIWPLVVAGGSVTVLPSVTT